MEPAVKILGYGKTRHVQPFLDFLGGRMATSDELKQNRRLPVVVAGSTKRIVPNTCQENQVPWYSVDSGYIGNADRKWKLWFRVTAGAWQDSGPIHERDSKRLQSIQFDQEPVVRGSRIMIVPPHPKVAATFDLGEVDDWITATISKIKQHTDRDVFIRNRPDSRNKRQFKHALQDNVNAVVVYNSNCGVESLVHGIPTVALGLCASTAMSQPIDSIDQLNSVDADKRQSWLKHLSYCQFTQAEMRNGTAWRILHE